MHEVALMQPFTIQEDTAKRSAINRTIRVDPVLFDRLVELCENHHVSFSKLVNQCIAYALANLAEA